MVKHARQRSVNGMASSQRNGVSRKKAYQRNSVAAWQHGGNGGGGGGGVMWQ